jgi:hypothetical protein
MPTITAASRPHLLMKPSFSSSTITTNRPSIKLASAIDSATIISFDKRMDQKIWYTIKVEPLHSNKKRAYLIGRRFEDFYQLSQSLHERFTNSKNRAGSRLPPKIKNRLNILPTSKQLHAQRAEELNLFLSILFQKQAIVTESFTVLEFFSIQKSDLMYEPIEQRQQQQQQQYATDYGLGQENVSSNNTEMQAQDDHSTQSRWKRLRCTSFLARAPPSSPSTPNGLSSLCSQAANKIIPSWHRNNTTVPCSPQPSMSTPVGPHTTMRAFHQRTNHVNTKELKKSKSSLCIVSEHPLTESTNISPTSSIAFSHFSTSTCATSVTPSPSISQNQIKSTIKIKVIYDVDNIIVIQVPRTIALKDLRTRIAQKFSDPSMGGNVRVEEQVVLLFNDSSSSCCSFASNKSNDNMVLPAVLINKEQDLTQIMHTKWNRLEKVTLRCIM